MDPQIFAELARYGFGAFVAWVLWHKMGEMDTARAKREEEGRAECARQNEVLIVRIQKMEDERHTEGRDDKNHMLEVIGRSTRAFEKLTERMDIKTDSGQHPAKGI